MKNQLLLTASETPLALLTKVLLVRLDSLISGLYKTDAALQLIDDKKLVFLHDRLKASFDDYLQKQPLLREKLQHQQREKKKQILAIHEKIHAHRRALKIKHQQNMRNAQEALSMMQLFKQRESIRTRVVYDAEIKRIEAESKELIQNLRHDFDAANHAYEMLYLLLLNAIKKDESDILHLAPGELGNTRPKVVIQVR